MQRVLGARDVNHARWGVLFAGLLKVPVIFIMVLPGTFARVLYPGLERSDLVFPTMMFDLLPVGIRGIILVGLTTRGGAFWGLVVGHASSTALLVAQPDIHLLYVPPILFAVSAATIVISSLARPKPTDASIREVTWSSRTYRAETAELRAFPWFQNYRIQAAVLLTITAVFVMLFS